MSSLKFFDKNNRRIRVGNTAKVDMSFNNAVHGKEGKITALTRNDKEDMATLQLDGKDVTIVTSALVRVQNETDKKPVPREWWQRPA